MLMSHFAILDAVKSEPSLIERWSRSIQQFFGLLEDDDAMPTVTQRPAAHGRIAAMPAADAPTEPMLRVVHVEPEVASSGMLRWRRHPQLLSHPATDMPPAEREARHDAVRGLYAARAGAYDVATQHFARAAQCTDIDLSEIPGFWQLTRSGLHTAVDAYEAAGRVRDASALNARIRTLYRPRPLSPVPTNVMSLPERPSRISSNS